MAIRPVQQQAMTLVGRDARHKVSSEAHLLRPGDWIVHDGATGMVHRVEYESASEVPMVELLVFSNAGVWHSFTVRADTMIEHAEAPT